MAWVSRNHKMLWLSVLGLTSVTYMLVTVSRVHAAATLPIFPPEEVEDTSVCGTSSPSTSSSEAQTIFFITPTYPRREQVAELTRLGQTLLLAGNVHWVVAEDAPSCSPLVAGLLARLGLPYTHLTAPQPAMYREAKLKYNPRGVSNRRAGLAWVMANKVEGVVYFGDDDNTYDIRLFKEMAQTKQVSMFPVGFIGDQGVSSPLVVQGKVVGFSDSWFAQRKFPVDMAGFAVSLPFLKTRNAKAHQAMPYKAGYEEDMFLQNLSIQLEDIEPLAAGCTEVLVWHTKTVKEKVPSLQPAKEGSNLVELLAGAVHAGMATISRAGKRLKSCYDLKQCKTNG